MRPLTIIDIAVSICGFQHVCLASAAELGIVDC